MFHCSRENLHARARAHRNESSPELAHHQARTNLTNLVKVKVSQVAVPLLVLARGDAEAQQGQGHEHLSSRR